MKTKINNIPLNLQHFAQESAKTDPQSDSQPDMKTDVLGKDSQNTVQENPDADTMKEEEKAEVLMAEIARMKVEAQKIKRELDKALREKAEAKNALRAKQTAEEIEDEAKKEEKEAHDAEFSRLQEFERKTMAKERYLMQGMSVEMAAKAADAEVSGDMEALTDIQRQHTEATLKAARTEWQKSIPQPNFGTGEYSSMTKEEIMAIKDDETRVRAIAQNQHLFKVK